jgi:hypothetical protein
MIRHQLFSKGEKIHALISNSRHSHIVFPVTAIIHDVQFDEQMPRYQIRITKFWDDLEFLKRYLFDMRFDKTFTGKTTRFSFKRTNYKSMADFQAAIDSNWEAYMIVVDSVMCVKTYKEMNSLFNDIQDFLVEKNFKDLYDMTTRNFYSKGNYFYRTRGIFEAHLKKMLGEREPKIKNFFNKLFYRPTSDELDKLER